MAMEGLILRTQAEPDLAELVALYAYGLILSFMKLFMQPMAPVLA